MLHIHYKDGEEGCEMWQGSFGCQISASWVVFWSWLCDKIYGNGKRVYDYTYVPIDIADAIAKKHDIDYESVEPLAV